MNRVPHVVLAFALTLIACSCGSGSGSSSPFDFAEPITPLVGDETILVAPKGQAEIALPNGETVAAATNQLSVAFQEGATRTQIDAVVAVVASHGGRAVGQIPDAWTVQFELPSNEAVTLAIADIEGMDGVATVFVNPLLSLTAEFEADPDCDDPESGTQWICDIRAFEAWNVTTGTPGVAIGIVDSGLSPEDDTGGFHIDPARITGIDVIGGPGDVTDPTGHGTAVASVAAAAGFDCVCSLGVAWDASVVAVRVPVGPDGKFNTLALMGGIVRAIQAGARVVNVSSGVGVGGIARWGWRRLMGAVLRLAVAADALVVFAAGNNAIDNDDILFPILGLSDLLAADAWRRHAVIVAGSGLAHALWEDSDRGGVVDLSAPAEKVRTALREGGCFGPNHGTSYAAPLVSGVAALIATVAPEVSAERIKQVLVSTTWQPEGWDPTKGGTGIVDAGAALRSVAGCPAAWDASFAEHAGSLNGDAADDVAVAADGSIYVSGFIRDAATAGHDMADQVALDAFGDTDVFLAKYRPDGTLAWARSAGSVRNDRATAVAAHPDDGGCVVAGWYRDAMTLGEGANAVTLPASGTVTDIFIARYGPSGALQWVRRGNSAGGATDVDVDPATGDVVVTGWFQGNANFEPGGGTADPIASAGEDVFVARYAADGALRWAESFGGASGDRGYGIRVAPDGHLFLTGLYSGTVAFGSSAHELTAVADPDGFVAKLNGQGATQWVRGIGSAGFDQGWNVAATGDGGVALAGIFQSAGAITSPVATLGLLQSPGSNNGFLARFDGDGGLTWSRAIGNESVQGAKIHVAALPGDSLLVCGEFTNTATLGPVNTLVSRGGRDAFVAHYCANGGVLWAHHAGGSGTDAGLSVAAEPGGAWFCMSGIYEATLDVGFTAPGGALPTSYGDIDGFLVRFDRR